MIADNAAPATGGRNEGESRSNSPLKPLRERKIYISMRMTKAREEIAALSDEQKRLRDEIKAAHGAEQRKSLLQRRVYAVHHMQTLKNELQTLARERTLTLDKLRTAAGRHASGESDPE